MRTHPEYKDSEVKWIGEIPADWSITSMRFACLNITDGTHFSPEIIDNGKPYVTVSNITKDHNIDLENAKKISEESFTRLVNEGCKPDPGDILLTKDGTIGRGAVVKKSEFVILSSIALLKTNPELLNNEFGLWFLLSKLNVDQMYSNIRGSALTRLTIELIKSLKIPLPPVNEQIALNKFLRKKIEPVNNLIKKTERKIELLKEQRSSMISECITKGLDRKVEMKDCGVEWIGQIPKGWDIKKISWITSLVTQGGNPDYSLGEESDDFRVLKTKNLYDDQIYYDTTDSISEATFRGETRSVPEPGDLLVAIVGKGSIGKVNIFDPPDDRKYIYSRSLGCIRFVKEEINVNYIRWVFNSSRGKQILDLGIGGSTGQEVLKTTYLSDLRVPKPSLSEQKQISEYLDEETSKINQIVDKETKRIDLLKEYRQSLISSVVTGKIRVAEDII